MRRPIAFVVLAGVAAVLASLVVYSALKRREAEVKQAMAQTVEIVVAAHDLALGSKLDPGAVKLVRWSKDSIPAGAFTDQQAVLNGNPIVKASFVENEPIVASKLYMGGDRTAGVLPLLIPAGMRAMSVQVDEVSDIAGFVLPHTRVDVLVAVSGSSGSEKPFAKLVLQNVEVLAVAQEVEGKKDQPELVKTVTLLVTPEEAERLALASHEGSLRLAMRNYNDGKIVLTSGTDVPGLLRSYSTTPLIAHQGHTEMARGERPARRAVEIEIIRDGKKRDSVSFISDAAIGPTSDKAQASASKRADKSASAAALDEEAAAGFMGTRARTIDVP